MLLAAIEFDNLHQILRALYDEMMPLCSNMTGVAKGIAGLGALFYVAAKVWQSLARAEPIDVYRFCVPLRWGCVSCFSRHSCWGLSTPCFPRLSGAVTTCSKRRHSI